MIADQIFNQFKERSTASKVSVLLFLLLPLAGILCIILPELILAVLPYLVGGAMVVSGIAGMIAAIRDHRHGEGEDESVGKSAVLVILGVVVLFQGEDAISFIGIVWGLIGLYEVGEEFDEIIVRIKERRRFVLISALNVFELVLALLLIISPFHNIEHHILVLGVQLVFFPIEVWYKRRKGEPSNLRTKAEKREKIRQIRTELNRPDGEEPQVVGQETSTRNSESRAAEEGAVQPAAAETPRKKA